MKASSKIRILKKPDVTELAGEKIMIDFESGKYFMLTGAANDIWDMLQDGVRADQIVANLMDIYEIDHEKCSESTLSFLEHLAGIGFIAIEA